MNKYLEEAEKYARHYDLGAVEQSYYGPELLFGLMYEYLQVKDRVLDIAIGTGLDAVLFKKAGARITGVDGAAEMIKICKEKKVADELIQLDFLRDTFPFPDNYFDLSVANAIFHMIENPSGVIQEISRVLKQSGIFGFSVDEIRTGKPGGYNKIGKQGIARKKHPESGLYMYRHSDEFITKLCQKSGL